MRADLALVGFGRVGRRFATRLDERRNRLLRDHDLETRIVGIATRRHGATFSHAGLDVAAALGCAAADLPPPRGNLRAPVTGAADVIGALAKGDAPLRVLIETTTLAIADGQLSDLITVRRRGC